jgi:hypothetical protein
MHFDSRSLEQPSQIGKALLMSELDGEPVELQTPQHALAAKPRHVGFLGNGPRNGLWSTLIGILLKPRETETLLEAVAVLGPSKGIHVQQPSQRFARIRWAAVRDAIAELRQELCQIEPRAREVTGQRA